MHLRMVFIIGLTALLAACASAISKQSLSQVDPAISFQAVARDPERYKGKVILAGGRILSTTAREGESWVEVLQHPLDWQLKPEDTDVSSGRFLVRSQEFLDPAIYAAGKKITVVGEVWGKKVLPLKEMEYSYPVLIPREYHLWKPEAPYGGSSFHFGIGVGGVFH
jgi:outer membrane lipoprotein